MIRWLYELQEVELELERVAGTLQQVEDQLGRDDDLVQARTVLAEERDAVAELERRQRSLEWEVEDLEAKAIPLEEKLYGGSPDHSDDLGRTAHISYLIGLLNPRPDDPGYGVQGTAADGDSRRKTRFRGLRVGSITGYLPGQ